MRSVLAALIGLYQFIVSPAIHCATRLFGMECRCRFEMSCSQFAVTEIKNNRSLRGAVWRIAQRIMLCSPLSKFFPETIVRLQ